MSKFRRVVAAFVGVVCAASVLGACDLPVVSSSARCSKIGDYAQDGAYVLKCSNKHRWVRGITTAFADQALSVLLSGPLPSTPASGETVAQRNARKSAQDYLNVSSFSRKGLIDQLVYEQFSEADATYAVDSLNVDWNQQAAKSAAAYLSPGKRCTWKGTRPTPGW